MRTAILSVALVTLVAGCASMAAYQAEQAKWQGLADQATAALGASQVTVVLKGNTRTGQYIRLSRSVELGTASDEAGKTWLLAHELGHHVRGHINTYLEQEMEANAVAVQILQVSGRSEEDAVRLVGNRLLSIRTSGSTLTGKGHDWCAEFASLRSHYPQYPPRDPAKVNTTCPGTGG
jgi:hypothetical protein